MNPPPSGDSVGWLTSPVAILLASGIGALLAYFYHRHVSALKSTIDFVAATEVASSEWKNAQKLFARLFPKDANPRPDHGGEIQAGNGDDEPTAEDVAMLSMFLDHFEFVAAAIHNGSMSEKLYKQWSYSRVVNSWRNAERYIEARREKTGQTTLYSEFQKLAEKWSDNPP